jgi:hypothetical protein
MKNKAPQAKKLPYQIPFVRKVEAAEPGASQAVFTGWTLPAGSVPGQISGWEMRRDKKWREHYEWRDNTTFKANLKFLKLSWDGKATLEDTETEARYVMGKKGLDDLLQKGTIVCGTVLGYWKFRKYGNSYSLIPVF